MKKKVLIQSKPAGGMKPYQANRTQKIVTNEQAIQRKNSESSTGSKKEPEQKVPQYTQQELEQELPQRTLESVNPQAPKNIAIYDYFNKKFSHINPSDAQIFTHFHIDSTILAKDSDLAKAQVEDIDDKKREILNKAKREMEQDDPNADLSKEVVLQTMRNKFNYNTRECQTLNPIIKPKGISTEPPPSETIRGNITLWEIFDKYFEEEINKQNEKDHQQGSKETKFEVTKEQSSLYSSSFKRCLKVMECMVMQNEQNEKYEDYKYWWTNGDHAEVGTKEGHLLPIWRFSNEKLRKKNVTSICWNPRYADLFAISLGSYDFLKQRMGVICLYSLKNTGNPEISFSNSEAGVMSLDFHPKEPALLAVGLYDGTVLVYDIRNKHKKPIYQSTIRNQKHTDPVWQVKWNPDITKNLNFYSISSDGRVMNWILMNNKLEPQEVILLRLVAKNDEESTLIGLACGLCFDFNKFHPHLFIVGTEEGKIHKCSRAYSGQYQETYSGHLLAVYKVKWNNYHARTFISASADWTVRIWDDQYTSQIMCFDLLTQVVDAQWAPYSSTVFACATLEKIFVYDLNVDKYAKLAEMRPMKQPRLTNLAFNYRDPIILVGDTHGGVTLLKLSPNLTKRGFDLKQYKDVVQVPQEYMQYIDVNPQTQAFKIKEPEQQTIDLYEEHKLEKLLQVVSKWEHEEQ